MKLFTIYKILLISLFVLFSSVCFSQNTQTITHTQKVISTKNYTTNLKYGQTAYQIDRSKYKLQHTQPNGAVIYVYYYYVWFYNHSHEFYGGKWNKTSTYIQSIDITIDNINMGNNWMLITGDFYYLSYWSINPYANIIINYSKPLPY